MASLSGQRLRIARKCYGWAQDRMRDQEQWCTHVKGVVSPRAIINWEKNGISDEKLEEVASCFGIPAYLFVDETINDDAFRSAVLMKKHNPKADVVAYINEFKSSQLLDISEDGCSRLSEKLGIEIAQVLHKEIFIKSTQTNINHLVQPNERIGKAAAEKYEQEVRIMHAEWSANRKNKREDRLNVLFASLH